MMRGMAFRRFFVALLLTLAAGSSVAPAQTPPAAPAAPHDPSRTPSDELFSQSLDAATAALRVYGPWNDRKQLARIADIGYRVTREAGYTKYPISFFLIDMVEPNAFALPGGHIFVTRGMVELGLSDDELGALLGHEIAHVVREHGTRLERRATLLNILSQAVFIGAALTMNNQNRDPVNVPDPYGYYNSRDRPQGNIVYGSYAASVILSELLLRNYSRDFEDEADDEGQRWAAAAGYSPDSTERLMKVLGTRLPDSSKEYGYWRTHPFFDERVAAAGIRKTLLKSGTPRASDDFRIRTQADLLARAQRIGDPDAEARKDADGRERRHEGPGAGAPNDDPPIERKAVMAQATLTAWPLGPAAVDLRADRLHAQKSRLLTRKSPASRDYGRVLDAYDEEIATLVEISPESRALATFRAERDALDKERETALADSRTIWKSGVYETPFLETFLSNYPEAPEAPAVHLALGEAYSRLDRQADAVGEFLAAWSAAPESEAGKTAQRGLKSVATALKELSALAELAGQETDPELRKLAEERLFRQSSTYTDIADGAAYLKRFPEGPHVDVIAARLNTLAENLYGEVVLYQSVGDQLKAMERIQKILTHAPASPAAGKLLEKVVLPS
jgi:Zn-dependent protease with chaperone function